MSPPARSAGSGYAALSAAVREAGLLRRRPWFYAAVFLLTLLACALTVAAMFLWSHSWALLALAPVLAVVSTQFGFFGHDVGHLQVSRSRRVNRVLGLVAGDLLGGLSYGWWVAKHNAHHAHPNDPVTDPDVHTGVLVFSAGESRGRRGLAAWTTRHQAQLFLPMLLGEAVNLHVASIRDLFRPGRRDRTAEAVLLGVHLIAYVALLATTLTWLQALVFLAVNKGAQGLYLGLSFAPNHKGMAVMDAEQAADPLLRQVLTSRNVRGGWFTDLALGGLNYQVEHHLFPNMPRPNLRRAQPMVRQFCADRGVDYTETGAFASYVASLRHLHAVGAGLRAGTR